jgi:urea carboxylase
MRGPVLRFAAETIVCVTGAAKPTLDGEPVARGTAVTVPAGGVLAIGGPAGAGMRAYLAVSGGLSAPAALGSPSTFLLGGFGGHEGRALVRGDVLVTTGSAQASGDISDVADLLPLLGREWDVRVIAGPHGAPEHLTAAGIVDLFATEWTVDHRSDRTGVRLVGAAPGWARTDGGDAGLHPSNVHDSAYPVGAVMLSGDTPVVVGPDGPSLGGFVVPCVVISADRWMFAQARPGDRVKLRPVTPEAATEASRVRTSLFHALPAQRPYAAAAAGPTRPAPLAVLDDLIVRRAGDYHLLAEAGPPVLDLEVRLRVHLLAQALAGTPGITEAVEGVRSLLLAVDDRVLTLPALAELVASAWLELPDPETVVLPVREVVLPIAFDDPSVHEAMARYQRSVRPDAPWCPDNVEFIRRVNGLATRDEVFDVVMRAEYLVVGLGDVYLGAPVAVPLHVGDRLVTTKYDPARTWTPENAVGIGGVYLCVYGMEGPGGYQLVGRTVPVWRYRPGDTEPPWLLRIFDRLRFKPVSSEELIDLRHGVRSGAVDLETRPSTLTLDDLRGTGTEHSTETMAFTTRRQEAFAAERARWASRASS